MLVRIALVLRCCPRAVATRTDCENSGALSLGADRLPVWLQSKLLQQSLQFTGMGGPMGVYENYDT